MKVFQCSACGHAVYFQNDRCVRCNSALAFDANLLAIKVPDRPMCRNAIDYQACNWLAAESSDAGYCTACELNRTIPNLDEAENISLWQKIQFEKNHLVYSLLRFSLPVQSKASNPTNGLAFDFLDAGASIADKPVRTGHARGVITLDISEADDAYREKTRQSMGEPYRTLLGHFRHESAHYYWDYLVRNTHWLDNFRTVFGDERNDYQHALKQHYENGPPANWGERFISAYASCHPWEDWAESWAHYFHIVDTLESAGSLGLKLDPSTGRNEMTSTTSAMDPYRCNDVNELIQHWLPISVALNMLNRSLGQADAYPFVLSPQIIEKLALVQAIIAGTVNKPGAM